MIFSDSILFAISLMDTGAVLFLLIYFLITLSDLECDYLNAQECCSKLQPWLVPKLAAHIFILFLLLVHGHFILALVNVPMAVWLWYELARVPSGNVGVYDPVEIHNRGQLRKHMRDCMINLGYYLIAFFAYLYCMMVSLLKGNPIDTSIDYSQEF